MIARIFRRVRSRTKVVRVLLPCAVVVAFLFAVNVFMDAQTLTGSQKEAAEFGEAVAQITLFEAELQPGTQTGSTLRDAAAQSNPNVAMTIGAIDFPYYAGGARGIFFREKDWEATPPEPQYRLLDGRWPSAPGEVAIVGERTHATTVGDEVPTLEGGAPLKVVGTGQLRWEGSPIMLAAPGTWASLDSPGKDQKLVGFPIFELREGRPQDLISVVEQVVKSPNLAAATANWSASEDLVERIPEKLRTRAHAAAEAAAPWSERSPLSLWVPGLILVPATVIIGYLVLSRRFAAAGRRMVGQGVRTQDAVLGLWLVPLPTLLMVFVISATVGTVVGWLFAEGGVGRWGYYVANWRFPVSAAVLCGFGGAVALVLAWLTVRSRLVIPRTGRRSRLAEGARHLGLIRGAFAGIGACICLWTAVTMESANDSFILTGAATLTAVLLAPELVRGMVRLLPERTLSQRLVSRQIAHNQSRIAAAAASYVALVAVTVGMLVTLASYTQDLHTRHPSGPPQGQLLVDNDGTTFLGVEPGVRAVLETVPALHDQDPVQFYLIGERVNDDAGVAVARRAVGTADFPAVSYAFASVDDVEVAYGRPLTDVERRILDEGGALVPRPDRVIISGGHVELVDVNTMESVGRLPARVAEPVPTPWADTPIVTLVDSVSRLGLPHTEAAMLYSGVSDGEADAAEQALLASGYSPRTINKHERPPALAPAAAIIGSAVSLVLLVVLMSVTVTRAQVQGMRPWAAHLTRVGIRTSWATRSLTRQYLWVLVFGLPVGLLTVLASLGITRLKVPDLVIVIPWLQVTLVLGAVVVATFMGAVLAARKLSATHEEAL